ncbi:hypothetical protein ACPV6E_04915 [Corynebacterium propinquum]|uniref:Uncharacterized protein n=1 Tax=Corynebacterium propinquum TaxID=43769 RepID=A0AAP4BWR7_9CORY|nr:hypothetical protein [Corynebacterium propinquum]MDK4238276.1 hypothetical protein [Corynebacterium propinquum]MDK4301683.1 hypothetical protein [Corynebacterium propinquum]MDK4303330.1 hypothetical protein [Corynebacterium propinquum]MDK4314464.1 hypothetical protein [Corynebacterium propinquum]MDK4327031.1 hypothetical protein [Corynebacterium propinquum]
MTAHNPNATTNTNRWTNWAGTQTARARLQQPSSVDELTEAIRRGASSGQLLRWRENEP